MSLAGLQLIPGLSSPLCPRPWIPDFAGREQQSPMRCGARVAPVLAFPLLFAMLVPGAPFLLARVKLSSGKICFCHGTGVWGSLVSSGCSPPLVRACWGGAGPCVAQPSELLVAPSWRALQTILWKKQCLPAYCNYLRQRWCPGGEVGTGREGDQNKSGDAFTVPAENGGRRSQEPALGRFWEA